MYVEAMRFDWELETAALTDEYARLAMARSLKANWDGPSTVISAAGIRKSSRQVVKRVFQRRETRWRPPSPDPGASELLLGKYVAGNHCRATVLRQ